MSEPATAVTDFVMAASAIAFAAVLARKGARWWAAAFAWTSVSALAGGIYHGFWQADAIWRITLATGAVASYALMRAFSAQWLDVARRRIWDGLAAGKLALALGAGLVHPTFAVAVLDFGASMLFGVVAGTLGRTRNPRAFRFLVTGIALFVVGGVIQQARLAPSASFDHNALFHVVQTLGNASLFLSALVREGDAGR